MRGELSKCELPSSLSSMFEISPELDWSHKDGIIDGPTAAIKNAYFINIQISKLLLYYMLVQGE